MEAPGMRPALGAASHDQQYAAAQAHAYIPVYDSMVHAMMTTSALTHAVAMSRAEASAASGSMAWAATLGPHTAAALAPSALAQRHLLLTDPAPARGKPLDAPTTSAEDVYNLLMDTPPGSGLVETAAPAAPSAASAYVDPSATYLALERAGAAADGAAPGTELTTLVPFLTSSLYVKNLSRDTTELSLYQWFSPYGALTSCRVHTDPATGKCKGVGFVNFRSHEEALRAKEALHGMRVQRGHKLHITLQVHRVMRGAPGGAPPVPGVGSAPP